MNEAGQPADCPYVNQRAPVAADLDLIAAIRQTLADHADPANAIAQQRYMKSAMPYRGLTMPVLRRVLRPVLATTRAAPTSTALPRPRWEATIRTLWDEAAYREERYAALALARHRRYAGYLDAASLPLARHLVITGAWWDLVDETAGHLVGAIRRTDPDGLRPVLLGWAATTPEEPGALWLRRTAIICQVGSKDRTDTTLLTEAARANLLGTATTSSDFFIRKAVGWALRDYARTDPAFVRDFLTAYQDRVSPLTRKEASRYL